MLQHKGTQTLYTERLILRKFSIEDALNMYTNWASDERVTKFLTWEPHLSINETIALLEGWCKAYDDKTTYNWVMEYDGVAIGNISVVRLSERSEYAELGYCMGYNFWNKGLMTEAANAVINYLFTEIKMHRVAISHATKNPGSGRVAQKCGLTYEGTEKECFKAANGEFLDIAHYGIINPN